MMFKIVKITDRDGNDRTDGRYPVRVGCTGEIALLETGYSMLFSYAQDAGGNSKSGTLQTSIVVGIEHKEEQIIVTTLNSVYTLQPV